MIAVLIITLAAILIIFRLSVVFSDEIKFFSQGFEFKFSFYEIRLLWKLAKMSGIDDPMMLFVSVNSLNIAISRLISDSKRRGIDSSAKIQKFLTKLYDFRTRLNLEHENKKGIDSTKYLDKGQRLRIILPGSGVFSSEIVNNGHEIIISTPVQKNVIAVKGDNWIGKKVNVYLWRKGDAAYVFDTIVTNAGVFNGRSVLYLSQTNKLLRTQKRRSVRCACNIPASMFFIGNEDIDFNAVETEGGYKVVIEDLSEDGAMVRVGGRGLTDAQIKLQFSLGEQLILMFGVVRGVEFNKNINQSRLHFECLHLDRDMKNSILSFVYRVLPEEEKEVFEALAATERDKETEENDGLSAEKNAADDEDVSERGVENPQSDEYFSQTENTDESQNSDFDIAALYVTE